MIATQRVRQQSDNHNRTDTVASRVTADEAAVGRLEAFRQLGEELP